MKVACTVLKGRCPLVTGASTLTKIRELGASAQTSRCYVRPAVPRGIDRDNRLLRFRLSPERGNGEKLETKVIALVESYGSTCSKPEYFT
jgi:hypothetical protein